MSQVEFQHKSLAFEVSVFMKLDLYMYFLKRLWNIDSGQHQNESEGSVLLRWSRESLHKGFCFSVTLTNPWGDWLAMENGTHLLSPSVCHLLTIHYLRTLLPAKTDTPSAPTAASCVCGASAGFRRPLLDRLLQCWWSSVHPVLLFSWAPDPCFPLLAKVYSESSWHLQWSSI